MATAVRKACLRWDHGGDGLRAPTPASAQTVADPASSPVCNRRGRMHRMFHHAAHTVQDKFVGYPDTFIEPPLGYYVNEQLAVQVGKANTHRFTFYRSDFLPGTTSFSPSGASRFNMMFARIPAWMGPINVEWTPEQPALAEQRRQAVLETLQRAGQPILADRVVIGPSPYPGAMGPMPPTITETRSGGARRPQHRLPCRRPRRPPREFTEMGLDPSRPQCDTDAYAWLGRPRSIALASRAWRPALAWDPAVWRLRVNLRARRATTASA